MPTDYKSRGRRKQKKALPGYLWLLSGLAIGLFVAFIVYLDKQPESEIPFGTAVNQELEQFKHANKAKSKETEKNITEKAVTETPVEEKEPKYNFYTILQGMKVLIPESETRPPQSKSHENPDAEKLYILQAGSFQNLADAEKLKAKLAFMGLEADIQHVTVNNQAWHRVRTGPYKDKQQLYKNQKILLRNNINAISMELKQH